jgi:RNA polymerase sigma-70 factor (ECF subfamily)
MNRDGGDLADLVGRARAGDVGAFEALYHRHQAGIYSFIYSQVRQADLAADLAQQTFVRAWESLPRLREGRAFRAWLHRIAGNLVRDEVKSGRARLEVAASDLPDDPPWAQSLNHGPEEAAVSQGLRTAVWAALDQLPAEQRAAVVMHHLEEMSVAEIAQAVGVRPGTIMSRLARAREVLRRLLSPYVEDSDAAV